MTASADGSLEAGDLARAAHLERYLGVAKGQIGTWRSRKYANAFPEPVAASWTPGRHHGAPLYSIEEVETWWWGYCENRQRSRGAFTSETAAKAGRKSRPPAREKAPRPAPQKVQKPLKHPLPLDLRSRLNRVNGRRP